MNAISQIQRENNSSKYAPRIMTNVKEVRMNSWIEKLISISIN